jgi:hypothetical protein
LHARTHAADVQRGHARVCVQMQQLGGEAVTLGLFFAAMGAHTPGNA